MLRGIAGVQSGYSGVQLGYSGVQLGYSGDGGVWWWFRCVVVVRGGGVCVGLTVADPGSLMLGCLIDGH